MIVLYILGYFYRNKQNNYAAIVKFTWSSVRKNVFELALVLITNTSNTWMKYKYRPL